MCRIKARVADGLIPAEKIVYIETASGNTAEVFVSASQVHGGGLEVTEVVREQNQVLVELPNESTSGDWRLWVRPASVMVG
jgi:hypothetical protein